MHAFDFKAAMFIEGAEIEEKGPGEGTPEISRGSSAANRHQPRNVPIPRVPCWLDAVLDEVPATCLGAPVLGT